MKMKTMRRLRAQPPRHVRRSEFDVSDATMEPDAGPAPEAVFDRVTGPFGRRHTLAIPGAFPGPYAGSFAGRGPGAFDEET